MSELELQSELTLFDVTDLVVGAIIGADIYVASSFGAGYLGLSSLSVGAHCNRDCFMFCSTRYFSAKGRRTPSHSNDGNAGHQFFAVAGLIVGGGALISVTDLDESGMMGTSRIGYALAVDGLFPRVFAKVHPRFKTPYLGVTIQAATALIAQSLVNWAC